jgi:Secretion system C-terminal sorting domain
MKKLGLLIMFFSIAGILNAQISITSTSFTHSQNFDGLVNSGTGNAWLDNSTILGWYSTRTTYNAGNGSVNTGALYSFGITGQTDRSLGGIASGTTGTFYFGVRFNNNIGSNLTQIRVNYLGEQWRDGGNAIPVSQTLSFEYSTDATSLTTGTWTNVSDLSFVSPTFTTTAGALDGNNIVNSTEHQAIISSNGADIWFRWIDLNDTGNDHGLAIDNFLIDNVLPVELTSFSAVTIGSTVKLIWNTATEINNYGFEVERSVVKGEWDKIGFVNGNGNSNSPKDYSFVDDKVSAGKYSYRLKQIDNDGQFEYSKTINVDFNGVKKFELSQNYPNPFNPTTTVRFNLPEAGNVKLTLFNIIGQELRTLVNEFKESGVHTINFDASDLNSGMYIYKIESGSFTQTRKMTLVK